jgi:broad specificity phosphatase PhoE
MEEFRMVAKRGLDFPEELIVEHTNNRILIVSHGALIGLTVLIEVTENDCLITR